MNLRQAGQNAETLAADFLKQQNYRILERNYRMSFGEIDIIAKDGGTICFVEVKMRRTTTFGTPVEAIAKPKMRKLIQVAQHYLMSKKMEPAAARFDVVAVTPTENAFHCELLRNAFRVDEAEGF